MNKPIRSLAMCCLATAAVAAPATAHADKPTKGGCVSDTWVLNGPAEWLAATVAGVLAEGSTLAEQAASFGFESIADFEAWIIEGVFGEAAGIDANGDGLVCRATNTPSGYPEYYFQVHDNKYHAKFAG